MVQICYHSNDLYDLKVILKYIFSNLTDIIYAHMFFDVSLRRSRNECNTYVDPFFFVP